MAEVNLEVVAALEAALDLAREGILQSVALAGQRADMGDHISFSVMSHDVTTLLGLMQLAQATLLQKAYFTPPSDPA